MKRINYMRSRFQRRSVPNEPPPYDGLSSCEVCRFPEPTRTTQPHPIEVWQQAGLNGCTLCNLILAGLHSQFPRCMEGVLRAEIKIVTEKTYWLAAPTSMGDYSNVRIETFLVLEISDTNNKAVIGAFDLVTPWGKTNMVLTNEQCSWASFADLDMAQSVHLQCFRTRQWLQHCVDRHQMCSIYDVAFLPRRLINLKTMALEDMSQDSHRAYGKTVQYVALSYCWGTSTGAFTTTKETLDRHRNGINNFCLPRTLRDAITVCRWAEIQFLWVDALCIIQDDVDDRDWLEQSGDMYRIYGSAHFVIAADSASDVHAGFLPRHRQWTDLQPSSLRPADGDQALPIGAAVRLSINSKETASIHDPWKAVTCGSLSRRGWCLQEGILPNRLVHFTPTGLIWECNARCWNDLGDMSLDHNNFAFMCQSLRTANIVRMYPWLKSANQGRLVYKGFSEDDNERDLILLMKSNKVSALHYAWKMIVTQYTRRKLTKDNDKLSAISGLAAFVSQCMGCSPDTYLAGLWADDLVSGLLWYVSKSAMPPRRVKNYRAPSWSWASIDGSVDYFREENQFHFVQRIEVVEAKCSSSEFDPTGRVSDGYVILNGPIAEVDIFSTQVSIRRERPWIENPYSGGPGCAARVHENQYTWIAPLLDDTASALESDDLFPALPWESRYLFPALPWESRDLFEVLWDERFDEPTRRDYRKLKDRYYCLYIGKMVDSYSRGSRHWWLVLQAVEDEEAYERVGLGYRHMRSVEYDLHLGSLDFDDVLPVRIKII